MFEAVAQRVRPGAWFDADLYPLLVILQAWVGMLVVINPLGNFPVVDDWAYFASVKALVEHGQLVFSNWTATNLISQIAWGAIFAFVFGTSYTVLRISTLLLALLGTGALYFTLRESGAGRGTALPGSLLFLFNPLVCLMSASFMSDVPYAAAQVIAMLLLLRGLKSRSKSELWSGWCVAAIALLCRQVGMAIPIGYGAARLAQVRPVWRGVLLAAVPFTAFAAIQFLFQAGLQHWHVLPADFGRQIDFMAANIANSSPLTLAENVLLLGIDCTCFLGLCLLPLSVLVIAQYTQPLPRVMAIMIWSWMTVLALVVASIEPPMREWSNVSWTLIGPDVAGVPHSLAFWAVITTLSAFGGIALVFSLGLKAIPLFQNLRNATAIPALFSLVTAAALFGAMALLPRDKQFDRYIIPLIPCFIVFLSARAGSAPPAEQPIPRWAAIASNGLFAAIAAWSLLGTHDYFAEKRVQWAALQDLVQNDHVPPEIIDAGWTYNAPTSFGVYGDPNRTETWFRRQDYFIGSNMLPALATAKGFTPVRDYPIAHWAPWNMVPARIVILRRNQPNQPRNE
jgi:hypothetical protein